MVVCRPMRWYRLLLLIGVGSTLGLAWNAWSGRGLPLTANVYLQPGEETVGVAEAKRRFDRGAALFVDARPKMIYDLERIPGALSLPEDEFDAAFARLEPRLRNRFDVIVYCSGFGCEASHIVARKLKEKGIPAVVLQDGMPAWQEAGYPAQGRAR
jgi:rhodanese-related sulfurtransferase